MGLQLGLVTDSVAECQVQLNLLSLPNQWASISQCLNMNFSPLGCLSASKFCMNLSNVNFIAVSENLVQLTFFLFFLVIWHARERAGELARFGPSANLPQPCDWDKITLECTRLLNLSVLELSDYSKQALKLIIRCIYIAWVRHNSLLVPDANKGAQLAQFQQNLPNILALAVSDGPFLLKYIG